MREVPAWNYDTITEMKKTITSSDEMMEFGAKLGAQLRGGECIILTGDVGAGKTVLTKGLARGLAVDDDVQSPTFTISRVYKGRDELELAHYDFYRLSEPGIMKDELREVLSDSQVITVVEWADIVENVVPDKAIRIMISPLSETSRSLEITGADTLLRGESI